MVVVAWKTVTLYRVSIRVPSIAQLVERRTVEVYLISLGRWFESGSKEMTFYFKSLPNYFRHMYTFFLNLKDADLSSLRKQSFSGFLS